MYSSGLNRPEKEQQVKIMKTDQMGVEQGGGKVSGIFHLMRAGSDTFTLLMVSLVRCTGYHGHNTGRRVWVWFVARNLQE